MERQLQQLWAYILKIDADSISADDIFLRARGDSVGCNVARGGGSRAGHSGGLGII
jgi:hypothetical protein